MRRATASNQASGAVRPNSRQNKGKENNMAELSLDEFLGHSSSTRGGGRVVVWRKREPAQMDTWLHSKSSIIALWRHGWPRLAEIERDGEKTTEVWGGQFNCWEDEDVLRSQYQRDDQGSRKRPPQVCPFCLLLEHLRTEVRMGALSWVEPIFRFEGDDPDQAQVLTAGGLYNAFGGDLSRQEVAELRRAGIRRDEAWKQNGMAKCAYVFSIVDNAEPDKGPQVAIETTALGDAVKRVIRNQIDARGAVKGNPIKTPYGIRWKYNEKEKEFSKKYDAFALPDLAMSPEVQAAIVDAPPPDVRGIVTKGNIASLRSVMEARALIELPFDRIFGAAEALEKGAQQEGQAEAQQEGPSRPPVARPAPRPAPPRPSPPPAQKVAANASYGTVGTSSGAAPAPGRRVAKQAAAEPQEPTYPPGTVTLPCDNCGAVMAETEDTCWRCGTRYEMEAPAPQKKGPQPIGPGEAPQGEWPGEGPGF